MTLTIQQIWGTNATLVDGIVSFHVADFASAGLDGNNPSPTQIFAAQTKYVETTTANLTDDPTVGVSPPAYLQDKSSVTRGTSKQVAYPVNLQFYKIDTDTTLDPNDVIA